MSESLKEVWDSLSWAERKAFTAAAMALNHTKETLAEDAYATAMLRRVAAETGKLLTADAVDEIGEALFDIEHENCEDACGGGGRPWYDAVAARLLDPAGPLAAVAIEQQIVRDDTGNSEGKETLNNVEWLGLLRQHYRSTAVRVDADDQLRLGLITMAALIVEWLADLDKRASVRSQALLSGSMS